MAITNATLAQKINDLIVQWETFQAEQQAWMNGVVGGGAGADGKYPLTDYQGTIVLATSPAQLEDDVSNIVTGALGHKNAAETAQTAAELAETNAELAETNAETAETGSVTAKVAAEAAQSAAESARTTAIAQAAAAAADAVLTAADVVSTNADVVLTNADVVLTGLDVTASAASAAAALVSELAAAADAATIVAGGYTQKAVAETITGAWVFTTAPTFPSNTTIANNGGGGTGIKFEDAANTDKWALFISGDSTDDFIIWDYDAGDSRILIDDTTGRTSFKGGAGIRIMDGSGFDSVTLRHDGAGFYFDAVQTTRYTFGSDDDAANIVIEHFASAINVTTPGLTQGSIHLKPGILTSEGNAVTWGATDSGAGETAMAGIYVTSDSSYGSRMYFGTTNSYASGAVTALRIETDGRVDAMRARLNASVGNTMASAGGVLALSGVASWQSEFGGGGAFMDWQSTHSRFGSYNYTTGLYQPSRISADKFSVYTGTGASIQTAEFTSTYAWMKKPLTVTGVINTTGSVLMLEAAAAAADTVTYGQYWVLNSNPNIPKYTDGDGGDFTFALLEKANTWTGTNSFSVASIFTKTGAASNNGGSLTISNANPSLNIQQDDAALDAKNTLQFWTGNNFQWRYYDDAWVLGDIPLQMTRSGATSTAINWVCTSFDIAAPLTATSFGGIPSANLVDKNATSIQFSNNAIYFWGSQGTTDGFYFFNSGDQMFIRPRDAAGTAWDGAADFYYDRSQARWNFDTHVGMLNAKKIYGLNNAGAAWREMLHITSSDNVVLGNTGDRAQLRSDVAPVWYDGTTTRSTLYPDVAEIITGQWSFSARVELDDAVLRLDSRGSGTSFPFEQRIDNSSASRPYWYLYDDANVKQWDCLMTTGGSIQWRNTGQSNEMFLSFVPNEGVRVRDGLEFRVYETADVKYISSKHDGTDGVINVSSGSLKLTSKVAMVDNTLERPVIKDYALKKHVETSASGTLTIDMSLGNAVEYVFTENVTLVTITNPPASGGYGEVWLKLKQHASAAKTIVWASKFHFPGGTDHVMSTGVNDVDLLHLSTIDGGTTYFVTFVQDMG